MKSLRRKPQAHFYDGDLRRIRVDGIAFHDWPHSLGSLAQALSFYLNIQLRKLIRDYEINEKFRTCWFCNNVRRSCDGANSQAECGLQCSESARIAVIYRSGAIKQRLVYLMFVKFRELSRAISHALRHEPWLYELELDDEGWASVEALIAALRRSGHKWEKVSRSEIEEMMGKSDKKRFELAGDHIRALYGHSLSGELKRMQAKPPAMLFSVFTIISRGCRRRPDGQSNLRYQQARQNRDRDELLRIRLFDVQSSLTPGLRFSSRVRRDVFSQSRDWLSGKTPETQSPGA